MRHGQQTNVELTVGAIVDPESPTGLAYSALGSLEPDLGQSCQYEACESDEDCICQDPLPCGHYVDECCCP